MNVQTSTRIWIVTVAILASILACLAGVFVWREQSRPADTRKFTVTNLRLWFPGYFRTLKEQEIFQKQYFFGFENPRPVQKYVDSNESCSFRCVSPPQRRRRSRTQTVFHGCCISYAEFFVPPVLPNLSNITRTIVQFGSLNQYFVLQVCTAILDCNGCRCVQEQTLFSAVVLKLGVTEPEEIEDLEVDTFRLNGCCKCLNV